MYKFLTRRNVLLCHAILFSVLVFIASFFMQLRVNQGGDYCRYMNIFWGCSYAFKNTTKISIETAFGIKSVPVLGLPLAGFLLIFLGSIGAFLIAMFVNKPFAKWIILVFAVIILAGAIMQFFPISSFVRSGLRALQKKNGWSEEQYRQNLATWLPAFRENSYGTPAAVIMGILGIAASGLVGMAAFADCKCCCKEEAPKEEAPAEEANPVEETPVEEAPKEEAPVEEAPVAEEAPAETPVEEQKAE